MLLALWASQPDDEMDIEKKKKTILRFYSVMER